MNKSIIIISAEHAGNHVPAKFGGLFKGHEEVLQSHRGWDPGSMEVAKFMSDNLGSKIFIQKLSRLIIEMNRSLHNGQLFSEFTKGLSNEEKQSLISEYYTPYRDQVENDIADQIKNGNTVVHLSIHSFTPVFEGIKRKVDVGLLCDASVIDELQFCYVYKTTLQSQLEQMTININDPYDGAADGFTTYLRTKFSSNDYLGIEIEVNQKFLNTSEQKNITEALTNSIQKIIGKKATSAI